MSEKAHILIVDDNPENIQVAMAFLKEENYGFSYANDGPKALSLLEKNGGKFDLILLDILMPGMSGFDVCKQIKEQTPWHQIPIIFLTAKSDVDSIAAAFELGGADYLSKPFHGIELIARVKNHVQLFQAKKLLQQQNIYLENKITHSQHRLLTELEDSQKDLIWMLTELMEANSDETGRHIRRVAEISSLLAKLHPTLTDDDMVTLFHASPMHDIGKMTIPHDILHKPDRYTEEEFEVMKSHTTNALNLLSGSRRKLIRACAIIAHEHHEKWDGSGYPRQLKGGEIHIYGRIVSLADVFDALTHNRCYKRAWEIEKVLDYIRDRRGTQFDPQLVDIFFQHVDEFIAIVKED